MLFFTAHEPAPREGLDGRHTNKGFEDWGEIFSDDVIAILSRFLLRIDYGCRRSPTLSQLRFRGSAWMSFEPSRGQRCHNDKAFRLRSDAPERRAAMRQNRAGSCRGGPQIVRRRPLVEL